MNTTIDDLIYVLKLLNNLGITYWLDGGWGVDALKGEQTRSHRDIDIDFDANKTNLLLNILIQEGYQIITNELPVRAELYSDNHGFIDIHPFEILPNNQIRQKSPDGGYFEFQKEWFGSTNYLFNKLNKDIPCISLTGQIVFHSGYELRDKDYHDLKILESIKNKL